MQFYLAPRLPAGMIRAAKSLQDFGFTVAEYLGLWMLRPDVTPTYDVHHFVTAIQVADAFAAKSCANVPQVLATGPSQVHRVY